MIAARPFALSGSESISLAKIHCGNEQIKKGVEYRVSVEASGIWLFQNRKIMGVKRDSHQWEFFRFFKFSNASFWFPFVFLFFLGVPPFPLDTQTDMVDVGYAGRWPSTFVYEKRDLEVCFLFFLLHLLYSPILSTPSCPLRAPRGQWHCARWRWSWSCTPSAYIKTTRDEPDSTLLCRASS